LLLKLQDLIRERSEHRVNIYANVPTPNWIKKIALLAIAGMMRTCIDDHDW